MLSDVQPAVVALDESIVGQRKGHEASRLTVGAAVTGRRDVLGVVHDVIGGQRVLDVGIVGTLAGIGTRIGHR